MTADAKAPARVTQSFVYTLSECWRRPSLTALEVLWRWMFGIPAIALVAYEAMRVLHSVPVDMVALQRMSLLDPMAAADTLGQSIASLSPPALRIALWLTPLLAVAWIVVSALGRGLILKRIDSMLYTRPVTLMVLQTVRLLALGLSFIAWFACLRSAAAWVITTPAAHGEEPNLVLYCAIAIVSTLGLFTLWAIVSWGVSVAPLLAMRRNIGAGASLAEAFRLGPLRSKLVEINLVMGIVKIALIILAIVLSACPLPFESVTTPEFMAWWYAVVTVLYFVASDFFHVAHLAAFLGLWENGDAEKSHPDHRQRQATAGSP